MENVPLKSVEDFPKQIPGGFSKGILGAILEGMQGRFYKKKVSQLTSGVISGKLLEKILKETKNFLKESMAEFLKNFS